jgi:ribosomal protein S8
MLEKTEGVIKNVQSRDTGNTGHTRQTIKYTKNTHNIIQKTYKMSKTDPTKKTWVNTGAHEE